MIWDTLAFNPDDMRYSCSSIACLQRYYRGERKLNISKGFVGSALSDMMKGCAFLQVCLSVGDGGRHI